jgi:hypothetical protein
MTLSFPTSAIFHDHAYDTPLPALISGTFVGFDDDVSPQLFGCSSPHNLNFTPVKLQVEQAKWRLERV